MEVNQDLEELFGDLSGIDDDFSLGEAMQSIDPGLPLSWGPSDQNMDHPIIASGDEGDWECVDEDETAAGMSHEAMDETDSGVAGPSPGESKGFQIPETSVGPLMRDGFSQHLAIHLARSQASSLPKQPWETSVVNNVFKPKFLDGMTYRSLGRSDTALGAVASGPSFVAHPTSSPPDFVKRRLKLASLAQSDDHMRKGALLKARALLMVDPLTTQLGTSLLSSAGTLVDETIVGQSFSDAFAPKATSTLVKRMSSLWRYGKWCMYKHLSPFNMKEDQVYGYLSELRESGAAPSSAQSFIAAVHFLHSIVFIKCFGETVSVSGRCKGLAKSELQRRRKRKQAPPLSVAMVRAMEKFIMAHYDDHRGVICGHLLFCIYSSARWSDTLRLVDIEKFHRGSITLLETATEHHKSALTDDAKSMFLPLLCLGQCLELEPWATYWLNARIVAKVGRPYTQTAQPGWDDRKGRFTSTYMSSTEATLWLREILEVSGFSAEQSSAFTSHSCKSTLLSWAAKSGLFSPSQRRRLGHHLDPQDKSMLVYSRDRLGSGDKADAEQDQRRQVSSRQVPCRKDLWAGEWKEVRGVVFLFVEWLRIRFRTTISFNKIETTWWIAGQTPQWFCRYPVRAAGCQQAVGNCTRGGAWRFPGMRPSSHSGLVGHQSGDGRFGSLCTMRQRRHRPMNTSHP